jgi:hypothetical protein
MTPHRYLQTFILTSAMLLGGINAATADDALPLSQRIFASEMTVAGIDDEIAASAGNKVIIKNGYKILLNGITGGEITRIRLLSSSSQIEATPKNAVTGNCGTSYFYLKNIGKGRYQFSTGFDLVTGKAKDFSWQIQVSSQWAYPSSGSYNFDWSDTGPMFATAHWTSGWRVDRSSAPFGTLHLGRVVKGFAYRTDGVICTSGFPNASVNVF